MLKLPIQLLYRVLKLFFESQHNKDEIKGDLTELLFKCQDKYGRPASVLFILIDFQTKQTYKAVSKKIIHLAMSFHRNIFKKLNFLKEVDYLFWNDFIYLSNSNNLSYVKALDFR